MVEYMKSVAESSTADLTLEERNLLSVAYKNVVGARRASLRIIGSIESKEKEKNSANAQLVTNYKGKVEEELNKICQDILSLLEEHLINKATNQGSPEAIVFYQKMKAGKHPACEDPPPPPRPPIVGVRAHPSSAPSTCIPQRPSDPSLRF